MMPNLTRLISETAALPTDAQLWELSRRLAGLFPDKAIVETDDFDFDIHEYARAGQCALFPASDAHAQLSATWLTRERRVSYEARNGYCEVLWRSRRLHVLRVSYEESYRHSFILADDQATAESFFAAVCAFQVRVDGQVLVFRNGRWAKDRELMKSIETARFEDLILPDELRETLMADLESFFTAKELYDGLGIAWKRGVLLTGPPGNGKTHALKALVPRLSVPTLYVRSFRSERLTPQRNIESVFQRARQAAPCLLVLEDLDSLVEPKWLSFFLNEMDGFAANRGVLTVGTTNHPERLDPALLERPSRFDRKIEFPLPAVDQRRRFLENLNERSAEALRMSAEALLRVAEATEGFSMAFLKELHLSTIMEWLREGQRRETGAVALDLVKVLRTQLRRPAAAPDRKNDGEEDDDGDSDD